MFVGRRRFFMPSGFSIVEAFGGSAVTALAPGELRNAKRVALNFLLEAPSATMTCADF